MCFKGKVKVQGSCAFPDLCPSLPHHWGRQLLPEASQSTSRRYGHPGRLVSRINTNPWGNGTIQKSPARPYDFCANTPGLAQKAFMSGHLYHTTSSISLLITHLGIRRWPGFLWHYTELPSANSLISAQNHRYFYSSNKAGTTVYNVRHCNE